MARILITGSSGRIGQAIYRALSAQAEQHILIGLDRIPAKTTNVLADLRHEDVLQRHLEGVDAIIHVAALHAPHVARYSTDDFRRINVAATAALVRLAKAAGVGCFVFTSTTALYGFASQLDQRAAWIDETTTPLPRTIYHRTKLEAETLLASEANARFLVRVMRMSRCFPEPAPLMAAYRLHRGIDARDVAYAHRAALAFCGPVFARFIVSATTPFKTGDVDDLKRDAAAVIRVRAPKLAQLFQARGWSLRQTIDRVYDSSHARDQLGWQPSYNAHEVVRQLDRGDPEVLPPHELDTWRSS